MPAWRLRQQAVAYVLSAALAILLKGTVATSTAVSGDWSTARATKPVLVATGDGKLLSEFPSSLNRFGASDSLLLIAQGNTDAEMPKGGFGRNFASYDDGLT